MNQEKDNISKMLMEVGATAEIVGVSKLTEILKHIQKSQKELTIEEYDKAMFIINIVCETYSMTLEDFYSNKRKNNRRYALGSVFYICSKAAVPKSKLCRNFRMVSRLLTLFYIRYLHSVTV
jgi:chromosomal replication initiation ATPase DnaA